jgi:hypothetical protein
MKTLFNLPASGTRFLLSILFVAVVPKETLIPLCRAQTAWVYASARGTEYFGPLYNTDTGLANGNPVNYCAPTATANTFQFLENSPRWFPSGGLTGGNLIQLRDHLANGWVSPTGTQRNGMMVGPGGVNDQSWWENMVWWLEDYGPINKLTIGGMVESDPSTWYRGGDLVQGSPTWDSSGRRFRPGELSSSN